MNNFKNMLKALVIITATAFILPGMTVAGNLEPSAPPGATMHTLEDIYTKLIEINAKVDRLYKQLPRFHDNNNGTVIDNKTGLIWMKDADEMGTANWAAAAAAAATLSDNEHGLTDGSSDGDWRVPTKAEWEAFFDTTYNTPGLCNAVGNAQWSQGDAFNDVQSELYWSSTEFNTSDAWLNNMEYGWMTSMNKLIDSYRVWPVRSDN